MNKYIIDKDKLIDLYINERKTYKEISEIFGCGETLIYNKIREYGIKPRNHSESLKGRTFSNEHRKKLSEAKAGKWVGSDNPNWTNGEGDKRWLARRNGEYTRWRKAVKRNALGICQLCGRRKNDICECCGLKVPFYCHHIKPFSEYPELRYEESNGIYICLYCHKREHGMTGKWGEIGGSPERIIPS